MGRQWRIALTAVNKRFQNMEYDYYNFKENLYEIKESLILIDALKVRIDNKKSLQKERWIAIQEKLRARDS